MMFYVSVYPSKLLDGNIFQLYHIHKTVHFKHFQQKEMNSFDSFDFHDVKNSTSF